MYDFTTFEMSIKDVKPHSKNSEIYGFEDVSELAQKIKESGYIKPLVLNQDKIIISGHRRYRACLELDIQYIPVEVKKFVNGQEELECLLLENMYRDKTMEQKVKEAEAWETIEKEKAEKRKLSTLKQNTDGENFPSRKPESVMEISPEQNSPKENFPQGSTGRTLDIVAKQVGIGSGKTLESAKIVVKKIDELRKSGDMESAVFLSDALNKSVHGAKKLAEENISKEVPDVYKRMVKDGTISVSEAYDVGKLVVENKKKEVETQNQHEIALAKYKQEIEEKQKLEEIEALLPINAVSLDRFRKPEETHIFSIIDFENLTDEQYEKCLKHAKQYEHPILKVATFYTDLDCLRAWESIIEDTEELESIRENVSSAIQNLIKIQNHFKGVKKIEKSNLDEES